MASKKYLVIFVLTLIAFACAENSEPIPDKDSSGQSNNAVENAAKTVSDNANTSTHATNDATKDVCRLIKLDLKFNDTLYNISSDDVKNTVLSCSNGTNPSATFRLGKTSNKWNKLE